MYAGRIVEAGETEQIMKRARHPYTISLLQSRLTLAADRSRPLPALPGAVPRPTDVITGCLFAPRCPLRIAECDLEVPSLVPIGESRVACIRHQTSAELMRAHLKTVEPLTPDSLATSEETAAAVTLRDVQKVFGKRTLGRGVDIVALESINLEVQRGESVALVGESGSGKSTLLRVIAGLITPTSGSVSIADNGNAQMVFQDAAASLTPWLSVRALIKERLQALGIPRHEVDQRLTESLVHVGLGREFLSRKPRQLSGGQAQRVAIARAIAVPPKVLLADEPTSALDVSIAATVLNLLARLRRELGFSMVFVTHDLAVARVVADRIVVLLDGSIVEEGPTEKIISSPKSSYTRALIDAVPGKELAPPPGRLFDSSHAGVSGE
jgi:peptide/nickel transport system ATP-binding protein